MSDNSSISSNSAIKRRKNHVGYSYYLMFLPSQAGKFKRFETMHGLIWNLFMPIAPRFLRCKSSTSLLLTENNINPISKHSHHDDASYPIRNLGYQHDRGIRHRTRTPGRHPPPWRWRKQEASRNRFAPNVVITEDPPPHPPLAPTTAWDRTPAPTVNSA